MASCVAPDPQPRRRNRTLMGWTSPASLRRGRGAFLPARWNRPEPSLRLYCYAPGGGRKHERLPDALCRNVATW
jgi:hypothetical protein